jgi:hypothetical protein
VLAVLELVVVRTIDDREIAINPAMVVSVAEPRQNESFSGAVHCVINFVDTKFLSVKDTCAVIRERLGLQGGP